MKMRTADQKLQQQSEIELSMALDNVALLHATHRSQYRIDGDEVSLIPEAAPHTATDLAALVRDVQAVQAALRLIQR